MTPRTKTTGRIRPRAPRPAPASPLSGALSAAGTLAPPLTVATSLMLYFGWARSDAQARAMGLDVSLFGYSAQDYVIRSISSLYIPLLVTAGIALACLAAHRQVLRLLRKGLRLRAAGVGCLAVGVAAGTLALLTAFLDRTAAPLLVPLVLAAGTQLASYGGWLAVAARESRDETPAWQRVLRKLLIGSVITLALFWELSDYASAVGRGYAVDLSRRLGELPYATAYSAVPLGIENEAVCEERLSNGQYRTTGLRLLAESGGRLFLLHDGWTPDAGTVVVLPDDGKIRWQFSRVLAVSNAPVVNSGLQRQFDATTKGAPPSCASTYSRSAFSH